MKKIIKSRIFYFVLGALLFGSIGVYAGSLISSNEVTFTPKNNKWNVTKVDEALNSLYSVAVPEEYTGSTSITPTYSDITLNTKDKLLKNNITISGIPNTYKNLTNTTTVTAEKLLLGETAYNNLGELITGNAVLGGDCVSGETITTSDCTTTAGCIMFEGFNPTKFITYSSFNNVTINYYDSQLDSNNFYQSSTKNVVSKKTFSTYFKIEDNKWIRHNISSEVVGSKVNYIVCK